MASAFTDFLRLARTGVVLAQHGVRFVPAGMPTPWPLHLLRALTLPLRMLGWLVSPATSRSGRLSRALTSLGPSYIKLGQFLATRRDLISPELAEDLTELQDKLPPFSMREARRVVEEALGGKLEDHFVEFGPPVAAASIAQVHKAVVEENGVRREVAVKVLRPDVERRFRADLSSFFRAARLIERLVPFSRRLKPVAVVDTLARSVELEMDLRLEAAAISEMADNIKDDQNLPDGAFRVPAVDWRRTARRLLTIEWIDGIPARDIAAIEAAGLDRKRLGLIILRSFLRHAMRDGFFHADMHQGNLLIDRQGTVVAVDFGIVGRLGPRERRFLAEILHGLITRDYRRTAQMHFDAGYVPTHHSVEVFAQAMRAIGEPIHGRTADEISMADLLGQLFAYTDVFDMETRPELILLQKTMVVVEGVARALDPELNMWVAAEPIAKAWVEENLGVAGRLRDASDGAGTVGKLLMDLPALLQRAEGTALALADMARSGVRLDDDSIARLARAQARQTRASRWATGLAALVLAGLMAWIIHTGIGR
ncbi:MAG: 2-polyprenylphenol 6-hydroxylase [Hyphomicrobiales bacterium]|nr:MAG: 2-polyprenylphenol 6-hydroxylase [Hyphomicrobiales bacterium]